MDNDDFRRGMPTSHKVFGEAVAILAGDALQTAAFELLAPLRGIRPSYSRPGLCAVRAACRACGSRGVIGGQVVDIESEGKPVLGKRSTIFTSIRPAPLSSHRCLLGAMILGGAGGTAPRPASYGESIGLAFQITDDILDVVRAPTEHSATDLARMTARKGHVSGPAGMAEARRMQQHYYARLDRGACTF